MKIGIMTDVNAGLDYIGYDSQIPVLRSSVNFKDEILVDGVDIKADVFYERLKEVKTVEDIPSTSAPSLQDIENTIEKFIAEGYTDIIHFPISFELSSTGQTVAALADEYSGRINIHVVNTKRACYLQGYLAINAKKMAEQGKSVEEIIARSQELIDKSLGLFVVEDLGYLVKNGRLSGAAGFLGGLFKIKPILELNNEGKILTLEKIRVYSKAVSRLVELVLQYIAGHRNLKIFAFHSLKEDTVAEIIRQIKQVRPDIEDIEIHYITPAVGAHIGSGVVGVGVFLLD